MGATYVGRSAPVAEPCARTGTSSHDGTHAGTVVWFWHAGPPTSAVGSSGVLAGLRGLGSSQPRNGPDPTSVSRNYTYHRHGAPPTTSPVSTASGLPTDAHPCSPNTSPITNRQNCQQPRNGWRRRQDVRPITNAGPGSGRVEDSRSTLAAASTWRLVRWSNRTASRSTAGRRACACRPLGGLRVPGSGPCRQVTRIESLLARAGQLM